MQFTLRKATEADIDFLLQLRDLTMRQYLEEMGAPTSAEEFVARVQYHFDDAKIIEINGKSAGLFKASFLPEQNQWYLVQIQIHPDYQGQNIGGTLIKQLIEKANTQGASVALSVLKTNPAKGLYDRLGFVQVGETEFEYEMEYPANANKAEY